MIPPAQGKVVFLKPGQIMVSSEPVLVTTLLGSCVAVTIFSYRLRLGAICHAQLPGTGDLFDGIQDEHHGKYVDTAIRAMLERLLKRGALRGELEAKVFGGADMFDAQGRLRSVGRQNSEMALKVLAHESVRVAKQDLGGERGRKIIFHSHTGEVLLKRMRKSGGC
ncbi:chemotaxis protein CheD [Geomonas oryzisoli]|uniref:Probable chemoreceptor glutamine deamidase CheD n=2 Tax=Geomonas oryzisoli TaxID=2847992 RepID=A0ABX8J8W5_9BACT|nr:chemotaxis protein CheD [Geomonas oryzisoli]